MSSAQAAPRAAVPMSSADAAPRAAVPMSHARAEASRKNGACRSPPDRTNPSAAAAPEGLEFVLPERPAPGALHEPATPWRPNEPERARPQYGLDEPPACPSV
jgi:hypothetical protein